MAPAPGRSDHPDAPPPSAGFVDRWFTDQHIKKIRDGLRERATTCGNPGRVRGMVEQVVHPLVSSIDKGGCKVEPNVWGDVGFFEAPEGSRSVFDSAFSPRLEGTRHVLQAVLRRPQVDAVTLRARQMALRAVEAAVAKAGGTAPGTRIADALAVLARHEARVADLVADESDDVRAMHGLVYFDTLLTRPLNRSACALSASSAYNIAISPIVGVLSPISYFVVPYLVLRYRMHVRMSFSEYLRMMYTATVTMSRMCSTFGGSVSNIKYASLLFSLLFYFQGVWNSFQVSSLTHRIGASITESVDALHDWRLATRELQRIVGGATRHTSFFRHDGSDDADGEGEGGRGDGGAAVHPAPTPTYEHNHEEGPQDVASRLRRWLWWVRASAGRKLRAFRERDVNEIRRFMCDAYRADAMIQLAGARRALSVPSCPAAYCTVRGEDGGDDVLRFGGMRHPALDATRAVANDIALGGGSAERAMVITGCNAAGKSTFIKAVVANVLLAQSGVACCAASGDISPKEYINTMINVPDCNGCESLFEAEMNRCKRNLTVLSSATGDQADNKQQLQPPRRRALIVMDELFSSTNPLEGISAAYAVATELVKHRDVNVVFTTHYTFLSCLESRTRAFANYRFPVRRRPGNGGRGQHQVGGRGDDYVFDFPYTIERGVSTDHLAIELLRKNGFDSTLVDTALGLKRELIAKGSSSPPRHAATSATADASPTKPRDGAHPSTG